MAMSDETKMIVSDLRKTMNDHIATRRHLQTLQRLTNKEDMQLELAQRIAELNHDIFRLGTQIDWVKEEDRLHRRDVAYATAPVCGFSTSVAIRQSKR